MNSDPYRRKDPETPGPLVLGTLLVWFLATIVLIILDRLGVM